MRAIVFKPYKDLRSQDYYGFKESLLIDVSILLPYSVPNCCKGYLLKKIITSKNAV